jgi:hypothetical protein
VKPHGYLELDIVEPSQSGDKPYLLLTTQDGQSLAVTLNIGEMIGGAATGARICWEAAQSFNQSGKLN